MNSRLPFEWIAALRFLAEGRMQTVFIVIGASIGVAVIVFMSAILAGMQANIIHRSLLSQAHIVLQPPEEVARPLRRNESPIVQKRTQRLKSIDQWQTIRTQLRAMPGIAVVTPTVSGPAFALRGDANRSVALTGIDVNDFVRIVPLPEKIVAGTWRLTSTDVLIGTELAIDLGATVGDKLRLATPNGTAVTLTITGIFDLGAKAVNERNVYVELRTAQDLLDLVGGASNLDVTVDDLWQAEVIAQRIQALVGIEADSWIHTNNQLFIALNAQTISNTALRISVAACVALGIASVLVVSVVQRSREIGILRAMGASRRQVMNIFLIQGGLVGLVGSVFGSGIAAIGLDAWVRTLRNPDGTPLFLISFDPHLVVWSAVLATLTGIAAAATPARRAAKLDPVVAIRA